jgi:hypothetical protein
MAQLDQKLCPKFKFKNTLHSKTCFPIFYSTYLKIKVYRFGSGSDGHSVLSEFLQIHKLYGFSEADDFVAPRVQVLDGGHRVENLHKQAVQETIPHEKNNHLTW